MGDLLGLALQLDIPGHAGSCMFLLLPEPVEADTLLAWLASLVPKAALSLQDRHASWLRL